MTSAPLPANASGLVLGASTFRCDPLPEWGMGLGVAMGVAGSIGINIGQNLQATGIKLLPEAQQARPWRSSMWRSGFLIFFVFALTNFAALAFAPASILAPLESLQFVTNVFWNRFVNKIRITLRMNMGVCLAIVGTTLTVIFGARQEGCYSPEQLVEFWKSPLWWSFLIVSLSCAAFLFVVHRRHRRRLRMGIEPPHRALLPVSYALCYSLAGGAQLIVHSKCISVRPLSSSRHVTRALEGARARTRAR